MTAEDLRLDESRRKVVHWKRWGPYVAERAWGTVREDYSADGDAWSYFPHDHARSRAYRWNEDGLAGICDRHQRICLALALWNGQDPILKERLFGLSGPEGNHGEDVKEAYFYLDSTPTHSYMRWLYKYPQRPFPYEALVAENKRRTREDREYELHDTGVFDEDRYFDVEAEFGKLDAEDLCVRITATNRGPDAAPLHLLPTVWFRNTWAWAPGVPRPRLWRADAIDDVPTIELDDPVYGHRWLSVSADAPLAPTLLFTENETNRERLFGQPRAGAILQGRDQRPRGGRAGGRGEPAAGRHQGRGVVRGHDPAGRQHVDPPPPQRQAARRRARSAVGRRAGPRRSPPRGRRVLRVG